MSFGPRHHVRPDHVAVAPGLVEQLERDRPAVGCTHVNAADLLRWSDWLQLLGGLDAPDRWAPPAMGTVIRRKEHADARRADRRAEGPGGPLRIGPRRRARWHV